MQRVSFTVLCYVAAALVSIVSPSNATPFVFGGQTVDIAYWAGVGDAAPNTAVLVLDFGESSFAFGYGWNDGDGHTAENMLDAIQADGPTGAGMTYASHLTGLGPMVDAFYYAGNAMGDGGYPTDYPYSFLGTDGVNWTEPYESVDVLDIAGGSFYAWSRQTEGWYENPTGSGNWVPPDYNTPDLPVPEPASLMLLLVGTATLALRTRRQP